MTDPAAITALESALDEFAGHTPEADWFFRGPLLKGDIFTVSRDEDGRLIHAAPRLLRERNEARAELAKVTAQRDRLMKAMKNCSWCGGHFVSDTIDAIEAEIAQ